MDTEWNGTERNNRTTKCSNEMNNLEKSSTPVGSNQATPELFVEFCKKYNNCLKHQRKVIDDKILHWKKCDT